jgi:hypothetical protein
MKMESKGNIIVEYHKEEIQNEVMKYVKLEKDLKDVSIKLYNKADVNVVIELLEEYKDYLND